MTPADTANDATGAQRQNPPLFIELFPGRYRESGVPYLVKPGCEEQPLDTLIREALTAHYPSKQVEEFRNTLIREYTSRAEIRIGEIAVRKEEPLLTYLSKAVLRYTVTGIPYRSISILIEDPSRYEKLTQEHRRRRRL